MTNVNCNRAENQKKRIEKFEKSIFFSSSIFDYDMATSVEGFQLLLALEPFL